MNNNFDTLWKELWIHTETINNRVKKEYHQSKKKFENLKKGYTNDEEFINLESLIKNIKDDEKYLMNEWEIPKGRRNLATKIIVIVLLESFLKKPIFQKTNMFY